MGCADQITFPMPSSTRPQHARARFALLCRNRSVQAKNEGPFTEAVALPLMAKEPIMSVREYEIRKTATRSGAMMKLWAGGSDKEPWENEGTNDRASLVNGDCDRCFSLVCAEERKECRVGEEEQESS